VRQRLDIANLTEQFAELLLRCRSAQVARRAQATERPGPGRGHVRDGLEVVRDRVMGAARSTPSAAYEERLRMPYSTFSVRYIPAL